MDSCHYEKVGDAEPVCVEAELPFELPQGWEWARVGSISHIGTGATPLKSNRAYYDGGTIPWITSSSACKGTITEPDGFITERALHETNCTLYSPGCLVVAMYGEGKTRGSVAKLEIEAATNQACAVIEPVDKHGCNIDFVRAVYELSYDRLREQAKGGQQPNLNMGVIGSFLVPVPPLAEQRRIVSALDELLGLVDEVERSQADLTALLDRARAKVLDLAIRGRLVPQDPNDEPASELLARVREERRAMVAGGRLQPRDVEGDSAIFRGEDNSYYERLEDGRVFAIEDELPSIPTSWAWSRLSSVVTSCGGKTPSMSNNTFWEEGTVPWVTSKDMKTEELSDSAMHISEAASHTMRLIPPESVLVVVRSGILKRTLPVSLNRMTTTINQDLKALIPSSVLSADYLALAIRANDAAIRSRYHKDGTTVDSIDFDRMLGMLIPIPPLSEQRRIASVAKHYSKSIFGCIA